MMRKLATCPQAAPTASEASFGRLARLLRRIIPAKQAKKRKKKPLAVAHLYGLPRPGAL